MGFFELTATVVLISSSGVLSPGPLFFATMSEATRTGARAGILSSTGHLLVEFPLVMLLSLGLLSVASEPLVRRIVGLPGGLALVFFAYKLLRENFRAYSGKEEHRSQLGQGKAFFVGVIFTVLNPYFIIWWLTIGASLITDALLLASLLGVVIMYLSHIWMDYAWLALTAHLVKKGTSLIGTRGLRAAALILGLALLILGINLISSIV